MTADSICIREINAVEDLASLRPTWRGLLEQTPRANFFQTLDWLEVYWKHYGAKQRLRVLVLEHRGEVVGILPLVLRRERTKVGPLRFATYPLDYWGSFYGPIGASPSDVWTAGAKYLLSRPQGWDVLEPRWVGVSPHECDSIERHLRDAGLSPVITSIDSTAIIELTGTWEDYLSQRGTKWRNNYRRWQRRIAELGEVTYVRFRPDGGVDCDPRWDLYDQCLALASSSWQGSSETGTTLTHASVAAFLRDVHEAATRCGAVDLNLLYLNGRPVAFEYGYHFCGQVFGLRIGYDPTITSAGVGNLMYLRIIEDSFRRGDWRYDLGPGTLEAKRHLCTTVLPIYRVSCYRRFSLRQQVMRLRRSREARQQNVAVEETAVEASS